MTPPEETLKASHIAKAAEILSHSSEKSPELTDPGSKTTENFTCKRHEKKTIELRKLVDGTYAD